MASQATLSILSSLYCIGQSLTLILLGQLLKWYRLIYSTYKEATDLTRTSNCVRKGQYMEGDQDIAQHSNIAFDNRARMLIKIRH